MNTFNYICFQAALSILLCEQYFDFSYESFDLYEAKNSSELLINKDSLFLDGNKGVWYNKNKAYTGYSVRYHRNDTLMEKIWYQKGKKEGIARTWFSNGCLKSEYKYKANRLNGEYIAYWENGVKGTEAYYENGKLHGLEIKWHQSGMIAKKRQLVYGQESGIQKAWLKNGKLYVNYEAKNGRIFGMKRANSCYALEDEIVQKIKS